MVLVGAQGVPEIAQTTVDCSSREAQAADVGEAVLQMIEKVNELGLTGQVSHYLVIFAQVERMDA